VVTVKATYLLPLRAADGEPVDELAAYLRDMAATVDEVLVVDGSSPAAVAAHREAFGAGVRVAEPEERTLMGKVGNVTTGLRLASHDRVVIADDDVRYTPDQLARAVALLDEAEVVRPQNWFDPLPWHARLDTARTLLARMTGGDWPGTLAVRRSLLLDAGGYSGDVLFENLELVRTVRAAGGREVVPLDLLVRRSPCSTAHFRGQQIRQAYDEWARPGRLAVSLAVLPALAAAVARRRWGVVAGGVAAVTGLAEAGRRRGGGAEVFPASSSLLAAPWLVWRSAASWGAVGARFRGGARYRDVRIARAATPMRELRRRVAAAGHGV
jgi:Glycosyl transferase family 2